MWAGLSSTNPALQTTDPGSGQALQLLRIQLIDGTFIYCYLSKLEILIMSSLAHQTERVLNLLRELSPSDVAQKHDRWLRSQVEAALIVADNPVTEFIPHETVSSRWSEKKKTI